MAPEPPSTGRAAHEVSCYPDRLERVAVAVRTREASVAGRTAHHRENRCLAQTHRANVPAARRQTCQPDRVNIRHGFGEWRAVTVRRTWDAVQRWGAVGHRSRYAKRFGAFGEGSYLSYPWTTLYGERWMHIGSGTLIGPYVSLSVGMTPEQVPVLDPTLVIGDRCLINKGNAIVAHFSVVIGDDVFTGPNCYITDQNHAYVNLELPIGRQKADEKPVRIGAGSWLGHGVVVLPGVTIGEHVTVAAGSVVTHDLPDRCVAAGSPARVVRRFSNGDWLREQRDSTASSF